MSDELALFNQNHIEGIPWPKWPIIEKSDKTTVLDALENSKLSVLKKEGIIDEFEKTFAEKFSAKYALSFSSGTAAIHSACFACGSGPGFEVLTPSYTWMSAITAILHGNGTPIFCDVRKNTFFIDPEQIVKKATPNTKAVIVCHAWGIPAPMDEILDAARSRNIMVIEDASHSHGAIYKGQPVGTIGDIGCFSLQASKPLPAGEGGVLVTNNQLLYERAIIPGHHDARLKQCLTLPETEKFSQSGAYWKYRATPLEMALASEQLKKFDKMNMAKRRNFEALEKEIKDIPFLDFPDLSSSDRRGYYCCPCLYNYDQNKVSRKMFIEALMAEGATVFPGYDENWYLSPILQDMALFKQFWVQEFANGTKYQPLQYGDLPNTDNVVTRGIVFPTWGIEVPELVSQYVKAFKKVANQMNKLEEYQHSKQVPTYEK